MSSASQGDRTIPSVQGIQHVITCMRAMILNPNPKLRGL